MGFALGNASVVFGGFPSCQASWPLCKDVASHLQNFSRYLKPTDLGYLTFSIRGLDSPQCLAGSKLLNKTSFACWEPCWYGGSVCQQTFSANWFAWFLVLPQLPPHFWIQVLTSWLQSVSDPRQSSWRRIANITEPMRTTQRNGRITGAAGMIFGTWISLHPSCEVYSSGSSGNGTTES